MTNVNVINIFMLAKSLILVRSELRLFGCLLYKYDIDLIDDESFVAMAALNILTKKIKILLSTPDIEKKNNANRLAYILLHELCHILNGHLSKMEGFDKDIFGIAADHVINDRLDEDIKNQVITCIATPEDRVIINVLVGKNLTVEQVYKYLVDHSTVHKEKVKVKLSNGTKGSRSNGESDSDDSDNNSNNDLEIELTKTHIKLDDGQEFTFTQDMVGGDLDPETAKALEKELQADARRILQSPIFTNDKSRGNTGSKILELIQESIKVDIPWTDLLENVIKSNITELSDNKSWRRINKRLRAHGLMLPYLENDEIYDTLLIITDTSGSVSTKELMKFTSIIKESMYHFKTVVKIDHDTSLHLDNLKIYNNETIDKLCEHMSVEFNGRGGTSHIEVYDFIEQIYNEEIDTIPIPGLILLLTDFESNIESIHHRYRWPLELPFKYIISNSSSITVDPTIDKSPIFIK